MTTKEDLEFRKAMYAKTGVIYMYPMKRYTISITLKEKERMEKLAKQKKIDFVVLPKKIMIIDKQLAVLDWFIDHDVCPFFNEEEIACTIYKDRPFICRHFPKPYDSSLFEDPSKYDDGKRIDFKSAIAFCKKYFQETN